MIKINSFYIGNNEKSFYLNNFKDGINIIHSDDNNKGKTIVSQGIMYTLGNAPIFPKGFDDYKKYYFIVNLNVESKNIGICRKNDFFIVNDGRFSTFDSVNEFKRYFSENIYKLPIINKQEIKQMIGLELFFEMFFLPQDRRQTSNLSNKGRYTKDDFVEALYSFMGCGDFIDKGYDDLKSDIKELENRRQLLKKSNKFLKSKKLEAQFITYSASKQNFDEKIKKVEKLKNEITDLNNSKNRFVNKKIKNELLLREIVSLNRELESGKLVCLECGSDKIGYSSVDSTIKFEISDLDIRNEIKNNIENRIQICMENILDVDSKIIEKKNELSELMKDDDISIENLILYKNDIMGAIPIDQQIYELDKQITSLKDQIIKISNRSNQNKDLREKVYNKFIEYMNLFYDKSESEDPLIINQIFTNNDVNYSGSQGTLYLMSRIYACSRLMDSDFPIIIDHFRGGELSSIKEEKILELFLALNKQIILTCTLKQEENDKYANNNSVHDISFDGVTKFKLLQPKYNKEFRDELKRFHINLDVQ